MNLAPASHNNGLFARPDRFIPIAHLAMFLLFALVLVRTAWTCDDAYISYTCAANLGEGYGLTFQPVERVQAFSNPLWTLIMAGLRPLTGEAWITGMVLGMACSLGAWWLLLRGGRHFDAKSLALAALLVLSSAFVDFSTSGLENSLSHLLVLAFALQFLLPRADRRWLTRLFFLGSMSMLCRLDLGFVVGPAMLAGYCSVGEKGKWKSAFLGLLPIIGWELFSLIYYGFLLPNTWYAKLSTGEDRWFLIGKGFIYLRDTLRHDPVTMGLILLGLLQVGGRGNGRQRWLMLGGLLYLAAVISAGGDFMRGRMFTVPFVLMAFLILRSPLPRWWPAAAGLFLVLGLVRADAPLFSGSDYHVGRTERPWELYPDNITDERAMYWMRLGWWADRQQWPFPTGGAFYEASARANRSGWANENRIESVIVAGAVGIRGYHRASGTYIIDENGLSDPLLARLPGIKTDWWRAGHRPRLVPEGYEEALLGNGEIKDAALREYWNTLCRVTRRRIGSGERTDAVRKMLLGNPGKDINWERYRMAWHDAPLEGWRKHFSGRRLGWQPVRLTLPEVQYASKIRAVIGNVDLELLRNGFSYGRRRVGLGGTMVFKPGGEWVWEIPETIRQRGFDQIVIHPVGVSRDLMPESLELIP